MVRICHPFRTRSQSIDACHLADLGKRKPGDGDDTGSESEHRDDDEHDQPEYVAPKTATRGKARKARGGAGATMRKRKARQNGDGGNDPEQDGAKIAKDAKISEDNALFSTPPTSGRCCIADCLL